MKIVHLFFVACLTCIGAAFASDADPVRRIGFDSNLLDLLSLPAEKQTQFTRDLASKLAGSQAPTRADAESAALSAFHKIGLDMRESWHVTGLFFLGRDVPDFGSEGDLIWEVRITRGSTYPPGVSGIIWVSATKKTTRILFP